MPQTYTLYQSVPISAEPKALYANTGLCSENVKESTSTLIIRRVSTLDYKVIPGLSEGSTAFDPGVGC